MEKHNLELEAGEYNKQREYRELSENEQMYLVTIAQLHESGSQGLVPLSKLADMLSFLPVSVNQMVRKLADDGLLIYQPYKGVDFTSSGREMVLRILRCRRLWEVFLVKHLQMDLDEADALACRMEHITSDSVAQRLSEFLGNPSVCYHGHPIPDLTNETLPRRQAPLSQLIVGQMGQVREVKTSPVAGTFLQGEGIYPGSQVCVLGIGDDGSALVETGSRQVHLSAGVAGQVIVEYRFQENQPQISMWQDGDEVDK